MTEKECTESAPELAFGVVELRGSIDDHKSKALFEAASQYLVARSFVKDHAAFSQTLGQEAEEREHAARAAFVTPAFSCYLVRRRNDRSPILFVFYSSWRHLSLHPCQTCFPQVQGTVWVGTLIVSSCFAD